MKLNDFPLEIKLIIYEYYDPKDKLVFINKFLGRSYIECDYDYDPYGWGFIEVCFLKSQSKYFKIFKREHSNDEHTFDHFLWRKSQVDNCYERIKNK